MKQEPRHNPSPGPGRRRGARIDVRRHRWFFIIAFAMPFATSLLLYLAYGVSEAVLAEPPTWLLDAAKVFLAVPLYLLWALAGAFFVKS